MRLTWQVVSLLAYFLVPLCASDGCVNDGCAEDFEGLGTCLNVAKMDYTNLPNMVDLKAGSKNSGCKSADSTDSSCCQCFKQKNCLDDGCKDAFDGLGICVDVADADWAALDKYVDWGAGKKEGLCKNINSKHCCGCFKKKGGEQGCAQTGECKDKGGKCMKPGDSNIPDDWEPRTDARCEGRGCLCYSKKEDQQTCNQPETCREKEGKCFNPEKDKIPTFMEPTNIDCGRNCKCYVKKEGEEKCPQFDECAKKFGKCLDPGHHEIPAFMESTTIRCGTGCKCYVRKEDEATCPRDKKCESMGGKCFSPKEEHTTAQMISDGYKEVFKCEGSGDCVCFAKPTVSRCTNNRCTKAKGKCFMKGEKIPPGSKPMKGKLAWCNKKLGCKCYKVRGW